MEYKYFQKYFIGQLLFIILIIQYTRSISDYYPNLIINGDFKNPSLPLNQQQHLYPLSIQGWNCTYSCQVASCKSATTVIIRYHQPFGDCTGQVIDLNSHQDEVISQFFYATAGKHILTFNYMYPFFKANLKLLQVTLNSEIIFSFIAQVYSSSTSYYFEKQVFLKEGLNLITFAQKNNTFDTVGYKIGNISIVKKSNIYFHQTLQNTLSNQYIEGLISIPGIRVIFGQALAFFISFDRLQLYQYGLRTQSQTMRIFIESIGNILDLKGLASKQISNEIFSKFQSLNVWIINFTSFKDPYLKLGPGYGFFSQNISNLFYSVPYIFISWGLLQLVFWYFVNRPFGVQLRKFCFAGTLGLMYFNGNIEQFYYYLFGETTTLFYQIFSQKFYNAFVLFFLFLIIIFTFGAQFWWNYSYSKASRHFFQNNHSSILGIFANVVDNGAICLLFSVTHFFLRERCNIQLAILALIQIIWLISRAFHLNLNTYRNRILICLFFLQGILRMIFQLGLFLFNISNDAKTQSLLNDQFGVILVYSFIILWFLQFLVGIFLMASQTIRIVCFSKKKLRKYKKAKRQNNKQKQNKRKRYKLLNFILIYVQQ